MYLSGLVRFSFLRFIVYVYCVLYIKEYYFLSTNNCYFYFSDPATMANKIKDFAENYKKKKDE